MTETILTAALILVHTQIKLGTYKWETTVNYHKKNFWRNSPRASTKGCQNMFTFLSGIQHGL